MIKNLYGKVKQMIENRPAKIKRRAELLVKLIEVKKPLQMALTAALEERRQLKAVLDGVAVVAAEKQLSLTVDPINAEISVLTRELVQNPPALVENFIDEYRRMENEYREQLDVIEIVSQARDGSWLDKVMVDRASVESAIDILRHRMREVGELSLVDLSETELKKRIDAVRSQPQPILKKRRLTRETANHEYSESVA